jgi:two-component system, chemotaxis family, CheB/CheR fusion protein
MKDLAAPLLPSELGAVLSVLRARRGVDLSDYHPGTLKRRLDWRLGVLGVQDVPRYLARLAEDEVEVDRLLITLLVPVTSFFRDPAMFEDLKRCVLPRLVAERVSRGLLRAWVVGAASGEEVWSLAMLLESTCAQVPGARFQVLGTDVHPLLVSIGREGRYPADSAASVPAPLRQRYLRRDRGDLCVVEELRERVHFAAHDLIGPHLAPPGAVIASFDLVLCRNVLIYFDPRLREKAQERLSAVVDRGGVMVLGPAETLLPRVAPAFGLFPGTSPSSRIFLQMGGPRR